MPASLYRRLERRLEQEEESRDLTEAARRLADPSEAPIPYAEARKHFRLPGV